MHNFISLNVFAAYAELFIFALLVTFLICTLVFKESYKNFLYNSVLLIIFLLGLFLIRDSFFSTSSENAFNGMYISDPLTKFLKGVICIFFSLSQYYCKKFLEIRKIPGPEFLLISTFALLGQLLMMSSNSLLIIYLGIELLSLSLISLVALNRDNSDSIEAAIKFFVLAALASGFLLYGISMVYGATGSFDLNGISDQILSDGANKVIVIFGLVFIICGLAFKLGLVPFHMWIPDIYQGASFPMTMVIGSTPKLAAIMLGYRVLFEGFASLLDDWQNMFLIMAILSLGLGNLVAVVQTSFKRLMGYSGIANVGFLAAAISSVQYGGVNENLFSPDALTAFFAYGVIYLLSFVGAFGCLLLLADNDQISSDLISDLKYVMKANPVVGWCLVLFMLSMAGIPPTIGFYAKFFVLEVLISSEQIIIAVFAVLMSAVGAYYYLKVIKVLLFDGYSLADQTKQISLGISNNIFMLINASSVIILGFFPYIIFNNIKFLIGTSFFS